MENFILCGGLPRTGSTLLMSILQENPNIFTTSTCPIPHIVFNIVTKSRSDNTFMAMDSIVADRALFGLIHKGTEGWFNSLTQKPIVISKNRIWNEVRYLYPKSKFICMIRDPRDIFDSFMRVEETFKSLKTFNVYDKKIVSSMSYDEIYEFYFGKNALIDNPIQNIKYLIEQNDDTLFVKYEDLTEDPISTLKRIYEFINVDYYNHNLEDIKSSLVYEHDSVYYNERVLHKVHSKLIKSEPKKKFLPDCYYDSIMSKYDWFYKQFYATEVQ